MKTLRLILSVLSVVNAIVIIFLFPVELFVAERHWSTTLLTYMPQQILLIPTVLLLFASMIKRRWKTAGLNFATFVFAWFTILGFIIPFGRSNASAGIPVRVMSYNIRQGQYGANKLARSIEKQSPDIICMQETNSWDKWGDPVVKLKKLLPGKWYVARDGELAIFSRFPILHSSIQRLPSPSGRSILKAEVNAHGANLNVFTTHFNVVSCEGSILHSKQGKKAYLKSASKVRLAQKDVLIDFAGRADGPVVITGDLNTPAMGLVYRKIKCRYRDAFSAAGYGFGNTIRSDIPVRRIDYIFTDKETGVAKCWASKDIASDHLAVVADIVIRKQ